MWTRRARRARGHVRHGIYQTPFLPVVVTQTNCNQSKMTDT